MRLMYGDVYGVQLYFCDGKEFVNRESKRLKHPSFYIKKNDT